MKWDPITAVQEHAARVLADSKSKMEDMVSARKALGNSNSDEVWDALPDDEIDRIKADAEAVLAEIGANAYCLRCRATCACAAQLED